MGRASKCTARERMVSQETTAKTIESTSSNRKVRRQRSLWRRSNCSRRSEMAGRVGPRPDELATAPGAFLWPSFIVPASPEFDSADRLNSIYHFRIRSSGGNASNNRPFLNGTYHRRHKRETASPKRDA